MSIRCSTDTQLNGTRFHGRSTTRRRRFSTRIWLSSQSDRVAMAHAVGRRFPFFGLPCCRVRQQLAGTPQMQGLNEKSLLKQAVRTSCQAKSSRGQNSRSVLQSALPSPGVIRRRTCVSCWSRHALRRRVLQPASSELAARSCGHSSAVQRAREHGSHRTGVLRLVQTTPSGMASQLALARGGPAPPITSVADFRTSTRESVLIA